MLKDSQTYLIKNKTNSTESKASPVSLVLVGIPCTGGAQKYLLTALVGDHTWQRLGEFQGVCHVQMVTQCRAAPSNSHFIN